MQSLDQISRGEEAALDQTGALLLQRFAQACSTALLLICAKVLVRNPALYRAPEGQQPPPLWIRSLLLLTCTGVSFAHGSNDRQRVCASSS